MRTRKTIYLHIGDAKTGSSSIQKSLTKNIPWLGEMRYLYPRTGLPAPRAIGQHHLAQSINPMRNEVDPVKLYDCLYNEIEESKAEAVIISSEGFCSLRRKKDIAQLKRLLSRYEVKILAYVKRPDVWIESWYSQIVKNRPFISKSFDEYVDNHQKPSLRTILNYAKIFGVQNLTVKPLQHSWLHSGELIADFYNSINLVMPPKLVRSTNISPPSAIIDLLRELNKKLELPHSERVNLYNLIINNMYCERKEKSFFSPSRRKVFLDQYKDILVEFNETFSSKNQDFFDFDDLLQGKMVEHTNAIYDEKMSIKSSVLLEIIDILLKLKK